MVFHPIEIFKFIKNNILKIMLGTAVFTVVFVLLTFSPAESTELSVEPEIQEIEDNEIYTDALPANFYFSVESEDGNIYTNNLLVEQYVLTPNILDLVVENTDIKLGDIIDQTENTINVNYNDVEETKIIGVERNNSTHLFKFYVNMGDEKDNLAVANFYYELISEGNIPFLENKNVYFFKEPAIMKSDDEFDSLVDEKVIQNEDRLLQFVILGLILGTIGSIFILWLFTLFSKKLKYSFSYFLNNEDVFLLIDRKVNNIEKFKQLVNTPRQINRVVISEDEKLIEDIYTNIFEGPNELETFTVVQSISEIANPETVDLLIYFLKEGDTTRDWYTNQRKLDDLYNMPTYVVQINKF